MKRLIKSILQESKPYDFLLLMVSAIVGFVLSLFGDTNITCICATVIVVLFILFWFLYNISENNADYMKLIDREFENEHWYDVLYLAFPICSTLRRMGKYEQSVKVAEKMLHVLNKINPERIDADWIKVKYTDIEKLKEKLMINDLGYSYFILKKIEKAKQHIHTGIDIARKNEIQYAELKGWTILLQMTLIDNHENFFTEDEEKEIQNNFRTLFKANWGQYKDEFPAPKIQGYISYLKSLEIKAKYEYQSLKKEAEKAEKAEKNFLAVMEKLASAYKNERLFDKYYDCMKCVFETKLRNNALDPHGSATTLLTTMIDGGFDPNVGLTPIQYIKYVTIYIEYYIRVEAVNDKDAKENKERIRRYIRKIEKELWYVEDPCINKFYAIKKKYEKAVKRTLKV